MPQSVQATGFRKPLPLNIISWFQNVPFKFNSHRCHGEALAFPGGETTPGSSTAPQLLVLWDTEYTTWEGAHQRHWQGPGEAREVGLYTLHAVHPHSLRNAPVGAHARVGPPTRLLSTLEPIQWKPGLKLCVRMQRVVPLHRGGADCRHQG
jgi:hypothetical protein